MMLGGGSMLTATVSVALAAVAAVLPLAAMAPTKRDAIWAISKADNPMSIDALLVPSSLTFNVSAA